MISTRLQLEAENKVRLCFVCSGIPFSYLFVGRSAVTDLVASREAPVARNVKDPIWMEMHELPAMLDSEESRVDRVVIYEGRGPSCRDAIGHRERRVLHGLMSPDVARLESPADRNGAFIEDQSSMQRLEE